MSSSGQEDYLDKGLDAVEKKAGQESGHQVDPEKYRSQNEKVTDTIKGKVESLTGKKVPDKVSN